MRRGALRLFVVLSVVLSACDRGATGSEPVPTGPVLRQLRIVAGSGASDTVLAKLTQPLVVEFLWDGKPLSRVVIRFEGLWKQGGGPNVVSDTSAGILVSSVGATAFAGVVSDTTDENGRASVLVQLGVRAGDVGVQVTGPQPEIADTARFTIRPGNQTQLIVAVRDTVVRTGGSFAVG